ncbi:AAA domain-containing protein [Streptomyces sp. NPDC006703]|uniref:DEAD/DEAH box helicase n=1 Tax=Streptomyces sp. NPDC006703 TaxID=3364759 RepID=UPI00368F6DC2
MRDVLMEAFRSPEEETDFDGRVSGHSALLSFTVNQDGRLIKESVTLSSCGWAVSRTLIPGPQDKKWLEGFEDEERAHVETLLGVADGRIPVAQSPGPDSSGRPVAGLMSSLLKTAVRSGLGAAAGAAATGLGLGPIVGTVATKVGQEVGGGLLDRTGLDEQGGNGVGGGAPDTADHPGPPAEVGTKRLDIHDLVAMTRWVTQELGVSEALEPDAIRVKSQQVREDRADESGGEALMNSFFTEDLSRVANAVAEGDAGSALVSFLTPEESVDSATRIDVRTGLREVLDGVRPDRAPVGRWPAETDQPLALSQQFAVNQIMDRLGGVGAGGLYAVNGPPGTGKTTMLRDLVAAIVVRRAERLAELTSPQDAFSRKALSWETDPVSGRRSIKKLRPLVSELTGFEMVLASSNNGAVQNVTLEIPAAKSIGPSWREQAAYLLEPAGLLLGSTPAWGSVAACLGRRQLRSDFVEAFWWGQPKERQAQTAEGGGAPRGLRQLLTEHLKAQRTGATPEHEPPLGALPWDEAVARFGAVRAEVDALVRERSRLADLAARLAVPDPLMESLRSGIAEFRRVRAELQGQFTRQQTAVTIAMEQVEAQRRQVQQAAEVFQAAAECVERATGIVEGAEALLQEQDRRHGRPGFVRRLVRRRAVDRWEDQRAPFVRRLEEADDRLRQAEAARRQREHQLLVERQRLQQLAADSSALLRAARQTAGQLEEAGADMAAGEHQVRARQTRLDAERRELERAREQWGTAFPGAEWLAGLDDRAAMETRELSAPWMDPSFAEARTRLFLAALDLHQALIAGAAKTVQENLFAAMEVIKGSAPSDLPAETVQAAWQMLFLVVPVVSTTFASLGRMFDRLGRESLGWLLIDEAGQAAPQQAVGALWRSRRAVVVGDPLQLEPVVTLPMTGQKRLCRHFGVDAQWAPGAGSVQSLADRQTPYGTWLGGEEQGPVWVGSPLRVHRRCDRLMFDVSNEIAYDGMMVYGVNERDDEGVPLTRSVWLHVPSAAAGGKWNPEEGRYAKETLRLVKQRIAEELGTESAEILQVLGESVFMVSPFREISNQLSRAVASRGSGERLLPEERVGTVHTTQGKEADIVVMVLGTAARAAGSRQWASKSPNLLNVAVTRARRRLIVIGDRTTWSRHRYFSTLAAHPLLHPTDAADWLR